MRPPTSFNADMASLIKLPPPNTYVHNLLCISPRQTGDLLVSHASCRCQGCLCGTKSANIQLAGIDCEI